MAVPNVREELITQLDDLTDEQIVVLLRYVDVIRATSSASTDPAVGFFSADPDFASRTEEILRAGFGRPKLQFQKDSP